MLNSIKKSMTRETFLYINESTSDFHGYDGDCSLKMTKQEILDTMDKGGFQLEEIIDIKTSLVFRYKLKFKK